MSANLEDGRITATVEVTVPEEGAPTVLELPLAESGDAVEGRVIDEAGRAIPDAAVLVSERRGRVWNVRTGAQGEFRAEGVAPGPCYASAPLPGYEDREVSFVKTPGVHRLDPNVKVSLRPVTGIVVDSAGDPRPADLTVDGMRNGNAGIDGRFAVLVSRGAHLFAARVDLPGKERRRLRGRVHAAGTEDYVRIVVQPELAAPSSPKAVVRGRVTAAKSGLPLPRGTPLHVFRARLAWPTTVRWAWTGADGTFECRVEPGEGYRVGVHSLEYARTESETFDIAPGEERTFKLRAKRGRPLRGKVVTPDGRPAAGAGVHTTRGAIRTGGGRRLHPPERLRGRSRVAPRAFVLGRGPRGDGEDVRRHPRDPAGAQALTVWTPRIQPRREAGLGEQTRADHSALRSIRPRQRHPVASFPLRELRPPPPHPRPGTSDGDCVAGSSES